MDWTLTALTDMTFIWPRLLWLLLLVPVLVVSYWWVRRHQRQQISRYAGLQQDQSTQGWRNWVPVLLMLAAVTSMLFAVSRPVTEITLPSNHETIVLAVDLSGSMRATDVEPSRLEAAQAAIRAFIDDLPLSTQVGIVTFGASAATIQAPTVSRDQLLNAVDRFEARQGTAIGGGIVMALKTVFPKIKVKSDRSMSVWARSFGKTKPEPEPEQSSDPTQSEPLYPVEPGSNDNAAIILLSDGQNNGGPNPLEMAQQVADYGVRIYTVGFGTEEGAVIGSQGRSMRVRLDEKVLREIAQITKGEYFRAQTAEKLGEIYQNLSSELVFEKKRTEVSSLFGLLGAVLALLASGMSFYWFNRIL